MDGSSEECRTLQVLVNSNLLQDDQILVVGDWLYFLLSQALKCSRVLAEIAYLGGEELHILRAKGQDQHRSLNVSLGDGMVFGEYSLICLRQYGHGAGGMLDTVESVLRLAIRWKLGGCIPISSQLSRSENCLEKISTHQELLSVALASLHIVMPEFKPASLVKTNFRSPSFFLFLFHFPSGRFTPRHWLENLPYST